LVTERYENGVFFLFMRVFSCPLPSQKRFFLWGSALALLALSCARQAMPPGGPEDRTPPRVVRTVPPNGSLHAPRAPQVVIEFSEAIDRRTVPQALFFTPRPRVQPKLKWRGRRLTLVFPDSFQTDQTYLITLGTGIRDRHGNSMKQTVTLAFSTGDQLDNGRIFGQVFGKGSLPPVQVWGYRLQNLPAPDPREKSPQYVTQCSGDGKFVFRYLPPGRYRLFAILDKDKNDRYTPGYDAFGLPPRDAHITRKDSTDGPLFFRIAVRDTLPPKILSALAPNSQQVRVRFSEAIDSTDASRPAHFSITSPGGRLSVRCAYRNTLRPSRVVLCTAKQDSSVTYTLTVRAVRDLAGIPLDSAHATVSFRGSAAPDTGSPRLVRISPRDSSRAVLPDIRLSCVFSEAMKPATAPFHLVSAAGDSISGSGVWLQPDHFVFAPKRPLSGNTDFRFTVSAEKLVDRQGNPFSGDSTLTTFHVVSRDTLTEISGEIDDPDSEARGPLIVRIQEINPPKIKKLDRLLKPGPFRFPYLFPGSYRLSAFRDTDNNGRLSPGSLHPFRFAERFLVYPDTVAARARWPNEENNLTLPK